MAVLVSVAVWGCCTVQCIDGVTLLPCDGGIRVSENHTYRGFGWLVFSQEGVPAAGLLQGLDTWAVGVALKPAETQLCSWLLSSEGTHAAPCTAFEGFSTHRPAGGLLVWCDDLHAELSSLWVACADCGNTATLSCQHAMLCFTGVWLSSPPPCVLCGPLDRRPAPEVFNSLAHNSPPCCHILMVSPGCRLLDCKRKTRYILWHKRPAALAQHQAGSTDAC